MLRHGRISSIEYINGLLDHGLLLGLAGQGAGGGADDHGLGTKDSPQFTGLTLSGLTAGSILFAGAGGVISEDNSNLFWNDTTKRLGIGTIPYSILHIKANVPGTVGSHPAGQLIIQDPDDTVFGNAVITGYESDGAGNPHEQLWYLGSSSSSNSNIIFLNRRNSKLQLGTNGVSHLTILGNGNVGDGVTDPDTKLEVFNAGTQLKLSYDATNYFTFATQSDGDLTLDSNKAGYDLDFGDGNLFTSGSLTLSSLTAGRVLFAGTGGLLSDDGGLLWNNTTKLLTVTSGAATATIFSSTHLGNPGATDYTSRWYNNSVLRSNLRASGIQEWWLNSGAGEVGKIAYTTPNGLPGIAIFGNDTDDRAYMLLDGDDMTLGASTGGGTPQQVRLTDAAEGNLLLSTNGALLLPSEVFTGFRAQGNTIFEAAKTTAVATSAPFPAFILSKNLTGTAHVVGQFIFANTSLSGEQRLAVFAAYTDGATNSGSLRIFTTNAGTFGERVRITKEGILRVLNKVSFTQTDDNEYIDSLADGYMDYGATTAHRFNTTVEVATKAKITSIGGYAIKLTNKTGANTVAGQLVKADTATDDAVILAAAGDVECFGVFLDSGIADAAETWVVVSGIADVAFDDNVAAARGDWVSTGVLAGYAAAAASPAAAPTHFEEIGHCIESVAAGGGGTHILARCVLHFN